MLDLLIHNATLPDGRTGMAIAVQDGRITEVSHHLSAPAHKTIDAGGLLQRMPAGFHHLAQVGGGRQLLAQRLQRGRMRVRSTQRQHQNQATMACPKLLRV